LPPSGSNGNLIDDISVVLKPLIDLNTQANFDMPEGDIGPSIQLRINGTVQTPTSVVIKQVAGIALPDTDFTLGTPVGLAGTTPTISHTPGSSEWTVTIPPGEYDAGQGMFGNAKYGIAIPIQSEYDVLRESTEPLTFELQNPGYSGASGVTYWDKTNPICEGSTTNTVTYNITEVRPKLRVHKQVVARVNAADQFTTVIKDDLGNVVSSSSASATNGGGVTTSGTATDCLPLLAPSKGISEPPGRPTPSPKSWRRAVSTLCRHTPRPSVAVTPGLSAPVSPPCCRPAWGKRLR